MIFGKATTAVLHVCSSLVLVTQIVPAPVAVVLRAAAEGVALGSGFATQEAYGRGYWNRNIEHIGHP